jgi:hypothetical protein
VPGSTVSALNLHTGSALEAPDAVQLEAARCWVDEQRNELSSGNGKSAVVQILRVFTAAGYPLDADTWIRAFFAAGGEFDEAAKVATLIKERKRGTRHRVKPRSRPEILSVLRERAAKGLTAGHRCSLTPVLCVDQCLPNIHRSVGLALARSSDHDRGRNS